MAKGKSGSIRFNSLSASGVTAMENHERRLDRSGKRRSVRTGPDGEPIPALVYDPYETGSGENFLAKALEKHLDGVRVNKGASKVMRHAFLQFPTDLKITEENEEMMLQQAVDFINQTHGGRAVLRARLDRDEKGQHGVDVFFVPTYEKQTKRGTTTWASLTKFGKELAVQRFGHKPKMVKGPDGKMVESETETVPCDSAWYQGRAYQDAWHEHLRDECGLEWVVRGDQKVGRDPDRVEPEQYALEQDRAKLKRRHELVERGIEAIISASQFEVGYDALWPDKENQKVFESFAESYDGPDDISYSENVFDQEIYTQTKSRTQSDFGPTVIYRNWHRIRHDKEGNRLTAKDYPLAPFYRAMQKLTMGLREYTDRIRGLEKREEAVREAEARVEALRGTETALRASVASLETQKADLEASVAVTDRFAANVEALARLDGDMGLQQALANFEGLSAATEEVLDRLNVHDEKRYIGEGDQADPPTVFESLTAIAGRKTRELMQTLRRARDQDGPSGPSM